MSDHELRLTRDFNAPRETLFAAWTRPEKLALWFGPQGMTVPEAEADARPGGRYRIVMEAADGQRHEVSGVYSEVSPPEKLAFTWAWTWDEGGPNAQTTVEVFFESLGDGTRLTIVHRGFPAADARDRHTEGWGSTLASLQAALDESLVAS